MATIRPNRKVKAPVTELTDQERAFVNSYVASKSVGRAYMASYGGDLANGYAMGRKLLSTPHITRAVSAETKNEHVEVSAPLVLQELARIAFVDISRAYDEGGALLPLSVMPPEVRKAISSIKVTDYSTEVKFWGKPDALDKLARHFKLFANDRPADGEDPADARPPMSDIEVARWIANVLLDADAGK